MTQYISKTARLFAELLANESIAASSIDKGSPETKALFVTPISTQMLQKQRSGNGNRYRLLHKESLSKFIDSAFPSGLLKPTDSDVSDRTYGVITRGDSKTVAKLGFDLIMVRGNAELSINHERYKLNNSNAAFLSLKISATQTISIENPNARIVTVENPTVFAELNKISKLNWDIAIYTAGKISNLLLAQLAHWHTAEHALIHFGDYDYVGLLEYARILRRCPKATLHWPTRLDSKFVKRYGKAELHEQQIAQHLSLLAALGTLPESLQKQQLLAVHELLQTTAKGLEQESFLIEQRESL